MKQTIAALQKNKFLLALTTITYLSILSGCQDDSAADLRIKQMDSSRLLTLASSIESKVKPVLAENLTLKLWGVDSLVISPIAIDIDDAGKLYYTTTNRQKKIGV